MGAPSEQTVQSTLNMILPIKSWLQFKESSASIHFKEGHILETREAIGNLHFARYVELRDHNHLGYFAVFDGDFRTYLSEYINYVGPVFDGLFQHVADGPPLPCERNREQFIDWITAHNLESVGFYSAFPTLTVKEIRAQPATGAGGCNPPVQFPLTLVLKVKSPAHFAELKQSLTQSLPRLQEALDTINMVYFLRFVPFGTHAMVLVADLDLPPERLAEEHATELGPIFNEIFENVTDGPPTLAQENKRAFMDWTVANNLQSWTLYTAYPTRSVPGLRRLATHKAA